MRLPPAEPGAGHGAQTSPPGRGPRRDLLEVYGAAIEAASGRRRVREALAGRRWTVPRCAALAVGKAAPAMWAGALEALGDRLGPSLVVTKHGYPCDLPGERPGLSCLEADHPVPGVASLGAGEAMLAFLESLPPGLPLLVLLSGGASALVEAPAPGVTPDDLFAANRWLLGSGLPIDAVNRVRKALSAIKGGRLAAWVGGRPVLQLLVSDVPGDEPRTIGSGPLVPHEVRHLDLSGVDLPPWLAQLTRGAVPWPPDAAYRHIRTRVVARAAQACAAAAHGARRLGYPVTRHGGVLTGDVEVVAKTVVATVLGPSRGLHVWSAEPTVVLPRDPGRGGRCQALALAVAIALAGRDDWLVLAGATDGSDGPGTDAGALVEGGTVDRGRQAGRDPERCLSAADAGAFLEASGDLLDTGPTGTNVMDLVLALRT